jgi:DNA-binding MarR family transcriptional regulator
MSFFGGIYREELPPRAKAVYMYLKDRADRSGKCWPGVKTIAAELSLSRSTVKRATADLVKAGLLRKEYRRRGNGSHTSNLYTIL